MIISLYSPYSKNVSQQMRFVLERAIVASKSGSFKTSGKGSGFKNFLCSLAGVGEKSQGDRLSRCSSLKNSPLSSPSKPSVDARIEELKKEIKMDSSMSLLHL